MPRRTALAAVAIAALAAPAAAHAHVTVQPSTATAGSFTVESVRVPNERDDAFTTKVVVRLPDGFFSVSYQAVPGWKVTVAEEKLAKPVTIEAGLTTSEQVGQVTFTATGKGIAPGSFQDFPLSLLIPKTAGRKLTFKALQTYSDGEVVRWIGAPGADRPAPQLTVEAADAQPAAAPPAAAAATPAQPPEDDGTDTVSIVALVVGALGLAAGAAGLAVARRRPTVA